jgi:hypothetical protein
MNKNKHSLERISFTLNDLLVRANALMLSSTKQALAVRPEKGHRLRRTSRRHEARCTCGLWRCRTDELEENEIARTFATQHAAHVSREDKNSTTTRPQPKEKR